MTTKRNRKPPVIVTTFDTLVRLATAEPVLVTQNRISHAAHYEGGHGGHDLDRWVIRCPRQPTFEQVAALGVAPDAKYHSGYVEPGTRQQHWIYTAIRPLSEVAYCPTCSANASRRLFAQRGLS